MADGDIVQRVEKLEETVDSLRDLPERTTRLEERMDGVEAQILELRSEMRAEFSAVRLDITTLRTGLREDIADLGRDMAAQMLQLGKQMLELRNQSRLQFETLRTAIAAVREGNPPAS